MFKDKHLIGIGKRNVLYEIFFEVNFNECMNVEYENENFKLWHKRLGHMCNTNLNKIVSKGMVDGIGDLKLNKIDFCKSCIEGKMTRLSFGMRTRSKRILGIIHTDVVGPITPISHDGEKYFVTFIDDYSGFTHVYPIINKSDVFKCFEEYVNAVQTKFNCKIAVLRCDNGGEYISEKIKDFCKSNGTVIDYATPYTPEQNGKSERYNRTILEKARAMIQEASVPKHFWNEAVRISAYIINRSPHSCMENKTPAEIWNGEKPNIRNMRIFGCIAYVHIQRQFRDKFDDKTRKCVMMGYTTTGYRLWDIENQKIIVARDVVFNENEFYFKKKLINVELNEEETKNDILNENQDMEKEKIKHNTIENNEDQQWSKKTKRNIKIPERYADYELYMAFDAVSYVENVPQIVEEINKRDDKRMWLEAMQKEVDSIEKNNTWEKVKMPENAEVLSTRWVFAMKPYEEKIQDKYKARLVVRGFAQKESFEYDQIYSPVARMSTIRTLLSVGIQNMHYFEQLDVKTAFLNGELKETIYVYPPEGVKCKDGYVLKLKKSLYGLKQSSKCWNNKINESLETLGFIRSETDYCLYIKEINDNYIYLLLYVDDIILSGPDLTIINECKKQLMKHFEIKDKGELRNFLGLEIKYDKEKGILNVSQEKYIAGILKRFNFENCNSCKTPIDPKLRINAVETSTMENKPTKQLIGCLMYLMLGSRPDISFSVNYYSRFQDKNSNEVWSGLKRLLRYIKETQNMSLEFKRRENMQPIICYVDSDWAGDSSDRKSVTGYIVQIFGNCVVWVTKKQNCIALSSTEAELIALCSAVCECLFIKNLLNDMHVFVPSFKVFEDNQSCIALIKSPENNKRVKHIDLKYKFICEIVNNKTMTLEFINSKYQLADILTKGQSKDQLYSNRLAIGLE